MSNKTNLKPECFGSGMDYEGCFECDYRETCAITKGRVLWFNNYLNYGFIVSDDGLEVFFHRNNINDAYAATSIFQGSRVEFELDRKSESPKALNIKILPRISSQGKPLLTVAFMRCDLNTGSNALQGHVTSKLPYGLEWVNVQSNILIATDKEISQDMLTWLCETISHNYKIKRGEIFKTELGCDILFI